MPDRETQITPGGDRPGRCQGAVVHHVGVTAYWISTYLEVSDDAKMKAYADLAGPALVAAGGRFLARGHAAAAYESGRLERVVVIEFPSVEAATAAHDGADYQAALEALGDGAVRDLRIVAGVESR